MTAKNLSFGNEVDRMMRGSAWRRRRLHPAGVLGWLFMLLGAAAVFGSLAVSEAKGIPEWEPADSAVRQALAAQEAVQPAEANAEARPDQEAAAASELAGDQPAAPEAGSAPSPLLDLNTATEEELDALPGIGPAKARAIIAYRESAGPFRTVDDLLEVKGIGPSLLEQIRPYVRAGRTEGAS